LEFVGEEIEDELLKDAVVEVFERVDAGFAVEEVEYGRILGGKGPEHENRKSENRKSIIC
jgi:hypothetical protein